MHVAIILRCLGYKVYSTTSSFFLHFNYLIFGDTAIRKKIVDLLHFTLFPPFLHSVGSRQNPLQTNYPLSSIVLGEGSGQFQGTIMLLLTNCKVHTENIRTPVWMYGPNEVRSVRKTKVRIFPEWTELIGQ